MKKLTLGIASAVLLLAGQACFAQDNNPQLGKDPVADIVKKMTLEEKARVVIGKGFSMPGLNMGAVDNTPDKMQTISGHSNPQPKYGIPSIGMADGPAGIHRFV